MAGEVRKRAALAAGGVLAALVLCELGVRAATGTLLATRSPDDRDQWSVRDPLLGFVPRPGVTGKLPGGGTVTIGPRGVRSNGPGAREAGAATVLVVGDSFAFGDEASDEDSWPARLERALGARVVNAGVPGYGLDQAVLRAEQLAPEIRPATVVVGFIPHDVDRCEMSFWSGHAKPWFEPSPDGLTLHPPPPISPFVLGLKSALSRSMLLDRAFSQALHWDAPDRVMHHEGPRVACMLMERLARFGRERGIRVVVLAQPQRFDSPPDHAQTASAVLACAAQQGLGTVDVFPAVDRLALDERRALFVRHMTPRGNQLVADELARYLTGGAH